ncbi:hypothetical protein [Actinomadura chokoriensis]|uniref:Uncharacterized protein n=1 Tax=Actinomadura chokoriensis TaxID=454156 RepID=A0ABV4QXH6_9ACTN
MSHDMDARDTGPHGVGARADVAAARDEAVRAIDGLDAARRRAERTRVDPGWERQVADAARVLSAAARELTRLVDDRGREPAARSAGRRAAPPPARRPPEGEPLVTLDLAHRLAPGWRLCQVTLADRDAHRWHLRHGDHAAGTVTHALGLRGRRTGWEARDARGYRLRPGPGPDAYRLAAPHLWATRAAAVLAVARAHRCP